MKWTSLTVRLTSDGDIDLDAMSGEELEQWAQDAELCGFDSVAARFRAMAATRTAAETSA